MPENRTWIRWNCSVCWVSFGLIALVIASFWSLNLDLGRLFSVDGITRIAKFVGELTTPNLDAAFLWRIAAAALETIAMSAFGTVLAALLGLLIALAASNRGIGSGIVRIGLKLLLNGLRSIPELIWAALLLISAGLGPFAGTLALALHTTGVLGRLFTEALENAPTEPDDVLRMQGVGGTQIFFFATLPTLLPQLVSYSLYRWENNIRAATILGVVGGGGLGQMLSFHMGLFQMQETSSILLSMILLVILVDALSYWARQRIDSA
jgi:phosphonate transport system permease protein